MTEQQHTSTSTPTGFFGRLGSWFRGSRPSTGNGTSTANATEGNPTNGHAAPDAHADDASLVSSNAIAPLDTARTTFFRPWGRRDAALASIQDGFTALTGLMGAIKENLDRQNHRQEELVQYLSHLPQLLNTIPAASQNHAQALATIAEHMEQQNSQQAQLSEILKGVAQTSGQQAKVLDVLHNRVDSINAHDRTMADSLQGVGNAMAAVSQTSQSSAQILQQMRDNMNSRQEDLQKILHKQSIRYTTMLSISLFLALAALATVCVFGWLMMNKMP